MSNTNSRTKNAKFYVCVVITVFFIFVLGRIVPPFAGITPVGVSMLFIFPWCFDSDNGHWRYILAGDAWPDWYGDLRLCNIW